jgi:hypothetical protein
MSEDITPLPNTPSWRGAQLKKDRDNFTLLYFTAPLYSTLTIRNIFSAVTLFFLLP